MSYTNRKTTITKPVRIVDSFHEVYPFTLTFLFFFSFIPGFKKRRRILQKITGEFDRKYQTDRQTNGNEPSSKNGNFREYLHSRLKWFNEAMAVYGQRKVANLNFSKYVATQQQMMVTAREIIGNETKSCHIVIMGDCSTPANSTIRGKLNFFFKSI